MKFNLDLKFISILSHQVSIHPLQFSLAGLVMWGGWMTTGYQGRCSVVWTEGDRHVWDNAKTFQGHNYWNTFESVEEICILLPVPLNRSRKLLTWRNGTSTRTSCFPGWKWQTHKLHQRKNSNCNIYIDRWELDSF